MPAFLVFRRFLFLIGWLCLALYLGCQKPGANTVTVVPSEPSKTIDAQAEDVTEPTFDGRSVASWREELIQRFETLDGRDVKAVSLVSQRDPKAIPILVKLLADPDFRVRFKAADYLGYFGPKGKAALLPLTQALHDRSVSVRQVSALAVGAMGKEAAEAKPALVLLTDADEEFFVRIASVKALWLVTDDPELVVPILQAMLKERDRRKPGYPDNSGRCSIAELLGEIGPRAQKAIPDLVAYVEDATDHWAGRKYGREALGRIGPLAKEAVPALRAGLKDPDISARVAAAVAMWKVTGKDSDELVDVLRQALREALPGEFANPIEDAIEGLGEFGPKAKPAVPDLLGVLALPEDYRRGSRPNKHTLAREALMKIDPEALKKLENKQH
jgi:HEAT repeat protein